MVPGPWNRAGLSRHSRSHRLAVVPGRPTPSRHVLRIARPVQHDVDRARRRRVAAYILRVCVLPRCGVLVCRQGRARCARMAPLERAAKVGTDPTPSDPRTRGDRARARRGRRRLVDRCALRTRERGVSIRRRRQHRRGPSRSMVLRRWLVTASSSRGMSRCGLPRRLARISESCCPRPARTRSRCVRIQSTIPWRRDRSCMCH